MEHFFNEIDGRILRGAPLDAILNVICGELVDRHHYPLVQIGVKGRDGAVHIRKVAGDAVEFIDDLVVRWDEVPNGRGPTGTAIRTGTICVCDIANDEMFAPWRDRALAFGLRAVMAIPLVAHGETVGALTVFSRHDRGLSLENAPALNSFADRIALSIAAASAQGKIRLQGVALEAAANAIVITGADGTIEWVNPAFSRLTGWSESEAIGQTPRLLRSGMHSAAFYRQMWTTLLGGQVWRGEMFNRRKDGEVYAEEQTITPVRDEHGVIAHFVAIKQDITARKRQEEQIRHLALHDSLTKLPNRRALDAMLDRVMWDARDGMGAAVLVVDVDDFKLINDSAGYSVGDNVLAELGATLQKLLRPGDFIARFGGDEFVILLRDVGESEALAIAERLRHAAEELSIDESGVSLRVAISIGVAVVVGGSDAKSIIADADLALHAAKERGRNRTVLYAHGAGLRLTEATEWLSRIRAALRDGRMMLTFQPVIRIGSGETEHFEALIRMNDGDEVILPDRFLPTAERYGLMPLIDRWVFDQVVQILEKRPALRIFANLSASSLNDPELLAYFEERLRRGNVPRGRLAFEITESAAVSDIASARNWIRRLKELGCLFALDDFGVGFSSLGYLRALAVDYVKIDRTFIRDVDTNPTNRALVQAVKSVAHTLGKEVIAEGVETAAHAAVLLEIGIEHGQGYHWGAPEVEIPHPFAFAVAAG